MSIKLNSVKDGRYTYIDSETDRTVYSFTYSGYPGCCLMGILSNFSMHDSRKFKENLDFLHKELIQIMEGHSINQLLIADIRGGSGYQLVETMPECIPLNVSFNKNSGNFVYLMAVYFNMS